MKIHGHRGSVAVLVAVAVPARAEDREIVFVDLERPSTSSTRPSWRTRSSRQQADEFSDERRKLVEDYEKLQDDIQRRRKEDQNTALSEEARNEKRDEAEEKLVESSDMREQDPPVRRVAPQAARRPEPPHAQAHRGRDQEAVEDYARTQGYLAVDRQSSRPEPERRRIRPLHRRASGHHGRRARRAEQGQAGAKRRPADAEAWPSEGRDRKGQCRHD